MTQSESAFDQTFEQTLTTRRRQNFWILQCAVIGLFVAPLWVGGGSTAFIGPTYGDVLKSKVQMWFVLLATQGAVWAIGLCLLIAWTKEARQQRLLPAARQFLLRGVAPLLPLLALLALISRPAQPVEKLYGIEIHLRSFTLAGTAIALAALFLLWAVRTTLLSRPDVGNSFRKFVRLQEYANQFLFVAAVILGGGIFGSAALRAAVNEEVRSDVYFPREYVILYGAVYSLILLVAYLPVRLAFIQTAADLRNRLLPLPDDDPDQIKSWVERKTALDQALSLQWSRGLPVLIPLLSGWVSDLLSTGLSR